MKKNNIIYCRCSTDMQKLEHQIKSCTEYAEKLDIKIDEVVQDFNISAYSTSYLKRPGLQKLLDIAEGGLLESVIVFESSRLSRGGTLEGGIILDRLTKCNVKVYSVTEGCLNENELSELLNSIRFFQNKLESKKTSERIRSSMNKRRENHFHLGGHTPFGYIKKGNKLEIDPDLKLVIIKIFETYITHGTGKTLEYLKEQGITKSSRSLMGILKNKIHCGYPYKNNDTDIYIPELEIIPLQTFLEAQRAMSSRYTQNNKRHVYHNKSDRVLEGLVYHNCGNKMYIVRNSKGVTSYRCEKCIKGKAMVQKSFSANKLESIVNERVTEFFNKLNKEELKRKYDENCNNELTESKNKLNHIEKLLAIKYKTIENGNQKLQELLLQNASMQMIEIITDSINQIKNDISTLESTKDELLVKIANQKQIQSQKMKLSEQLLDFKYLYSQATDEQKKVILHQILDKVIITDWNNIEVVFKN